MLNFSCQNKQQLVELFKKADELLEKHGSVNGAFSHKALQAEEFDFTKQRTPQQNKAIHKYFSLVSDALNDAGLDMRAVLKADAELPWTPASVKTYIWKAVQDAMLDKESTTALTPKEVNEIYEVVDRHLSNTFNLHVEFPSWVGEMNSYGEEA